MFLTYKTYLLSIETKVDTNLNTNLDTNLDLNSKYESTDWDQYFDIESQTIINYKNKNQYILKPYIQFRQLPANKLFKRKKQNSKKINKEDIEILKPIEEDPVLFEDIETGKIYKNERNTNTNTNTNTKIYLYLIKLQNIFATFLIYIFHLVIIIFLVKN